MKDHILVIKYPVIILILITFLSTSIPSYYLIITIVELEVDVLSKFLDATKDSTYLY